MILIVNSSNWGLFSMKSKLRLLYFNAISAIHVVVLLTQGKSGKGRHRYSLQKFLMKDT